MYAIRYRSDQIGLGNGGCKRMRKTDSIGVTVDIPVRHKLFRVAQSLERSASFITNAALKQYLAQFPDDEPKTNDRVKVRKVAEVN
jgi:hypothetical protein